MSSPPQNFILSVPPFPYAKVQTFQALGTVLLTDEEAETAAALLRDRRLTGPYWEAVPSEERELIDCSSLPKSVACPFTGRAIGIAGVIDLHSFWRDLIEANRTIVAAVGFAFWKQETVAPLLWAGRPVRFVRDLPGGLEPGSVAVWQARASGSAIRRIEQEGRPVVEVEDGFLRSQGLGADCVPPLSIVVDRLGCHFDPRQPSKLEQLLQTHEFGGPLLERAEQLRKRIVAAGLGKYDRGAKALPRPGGRQRHILVPGQVEDDRSVMTGGLGMTNLQLLQNVRSNAPDAFIIYKPHPDVEAGHRKGAIAQPAVSQLAQAVAADESIASLIDLADEVHVNTSLAGFEALLRGKTVSTYGVPFYAGWGLTTDHGPVPARRSRQLTLDQLVAATLILYPRYLDPVTGLPCPAEIVADRLCEDEVPAPGLLVAARRFQGKLRRSLSRLFA